MAKILKMPREVTSALAATTAPQDVLAEDAATFERAAPDARGHLVLRAQARPAPALRRTAPALRYLGRHLREALSHLVSEGLARTEAGRGFTVASISLADFLDLSELRVYLETRTLADAIRHGTDAWEAEIVSAYFLLNKLGAPRQDDPVGVKREWGKRHKRFHDSLVATCTSPWSLHFRSELFDQARRYHWLTMIHARSRRRNEHLDLRDAVLARDVDLACGLIEKHIRTTVEQAASEVPGLTMDATRIAKRRKA
jgi:DNA-binding GntR family transcriptional regulator